MSFTYPLPVRQAMQRTVKRPQAIVVAPAKVSTLDCFQEISDLAFGRIQAPLATAIGYIARKSGAGFAVITWGIMFLGLYTYAAGRSARQWVAANPETLKYWAKATIGGLFIVTCLLPVTAVIFIARSQAVRNVLTGMGEVMFPYDFGQYAAPAPVATVPDLGHELDGEQIIAAIERHIPTVAQAVTEPVAILAIELPQLVDDGEPVQVFNYPAMKVSELRQHCQQAGIQWRNAGPTGKHLRKAEMVALLSAEDDN